MMLLCLAHAYASAARALRSVLAHLAVPNLFVAFVWEVSFSVAFAYAVAFAVAFPILFMFQIDCLAGRLILHPCPAQGRADDRLARVARSLARGMEMRQ